MKYITEIQAFKVLEKFNSKSGCDGSVKKLYEHVRDSHKEDTFDNICTHQFPNGVIDREMYAWLIKEHEHILKYLGK